MNVLPVPADARHTLRGLCKSIGEPPLPRSMDIVIEFLLKPLRRKGTTFFLYIQVICSEERFFLVVFINRIYKCNLRHKLVCFLWLILWKIYLFNSIEIPFLLYYFPLYFETIIGE